MIKWLQPNQQNESSQVFACVSWDGCLYIYKLESKSTSAMENKPALKLIGETNFGVPATSLEWSINHESGNGQFIYVGLIDGTVHCYHIQTKKSAEIFRDENEISALNMFYVYQPVAANNIQKGLLIIGLEGRLTWIVAEPNDKDFKKVISATHLNGCTCVNAADYKNLYLLIAISKKKPSADGSIQTFENKLFYGNVNDFFAKMSGYRCNDQTIKWQAMSALIITENGNPHKFAIATTDGKIECMNLVNSTPISYSGNTNTKVLSASDIKIDDGKILFRAHFEIEKEMPFYYQIPF